MLLPRTRAGPSFRRSALKREPFLRRIHGFRSCLPLTIHWHPCKRFRRNPLYTLEDLGWGPFFQSQIADTTEELIPARVAEEQRGAYLLHAERGALEASVTGRMMHGAAGREDFPAVGDWVLARRLPDEERAVIH